MRPDLSHERILAWAEAFHAASGRRPPSYPAPSRMPSGETWSGLNNALKKGLRGLPGGESLCYLLTAHRGAIRARRMPPAPRGPDPRLGRRVPRRPRLLAQD